MNDNYILPECYIDTNLIETLVPPARGCNYNHQKGCPAVAKKMKEKFADSFAVGIMDKDKRRISYLQEFSLIASDETLDIYKHRDKHHYIILIAPAAEEFIIKAAEELNLKLSDYEIPDTLEELKKETKQIDAKNSPKYRNLFKALRQSSECKKLSTLVSYLKTEKYNTKVSRLKEIVCRG